MAGVADSGTDVGQLREDIASIEGDLGALMTALKDLGAEQGQALYGRAREAGEVVRERAREAAEQRLRRRCVIPVSTAPAQHITPAPRPVWPRGRSCRRSDTPDGLPGRHWQSWQGSGSPDPVASP